MNGWISKAFSRPSHISFLHRTRFYSASYSRSYSIKSTLLLPLPRVADFNDIPTLRRLHSHRRSDIFWLVSVHEGFPNAISYSVGEGLVWIAG